MLCFRSRSDCDERRSREIDSILRRDEKAMKKVIKLLLLGAGESGKSTILKQMRLIYTKEGFSKQEKEEWRCIIFNNILDGLRTIVNDMEEFNFQFHNKSTLQHLPLILQVKDMGPDETIPMKHLSVYKTVWTDPGFQKAVESRKCALNDNLRYFFSHIDRLFNKDFIPTDQDILQARLRTTGITETVFDLGTFKYRMFDVGGQRSERKKWIHCFENVNALIFLVAISGYDQCLAEDREGNQMQEALMLWESIANSHWFKKSALILFLNKIDLFRAKVSHSPITKYGFTDFRGNTKDAGQTSKYFMKKFTALSRSPSQEVYAHFTNATDTDLLK
ncbi:G protein alpha subunit, partial [Erysiphe pulchra]